MSRAWLPAALIVALWSGTASAATIALTNGGFESGLTGWVALGDVSATPSTTVTTFDSVVWTINADGTGMAQLNSNPYSISDIETFLGIAAGTLAAADTTQALTDGSAIYQEFTGNVTDTVSMYWDYVARDYVPFNDPAYALIIGPDNVVQVIASIYGAGTTVGTSGHSGWNLFSYTLTTAGTYKLAFVTTNSGDTILDSALFLDSAPGTCDPECPNTAPVPEPGTLGMLAFGLASAGSRIVRRGRSAKS